MYVIYDNFEGMTLSNWDEINHNNRSWVGDYNHLDHTCQFYSDNDIHIFQSLDEAKRAKNTLEKDFKADGIPLNEIDFVIFEIKSETRYYLGDKIGDI